MSIKVMSRVWDQSKQDGPHLLLILALADHASDDGVCWPGIPKLAEKVRKSERQVKRLLRSLEESGELYINRCTGRGNSNLYYITVGYTRDEIIHTLAKRFDFASTEAEEIASQIIMLQEKGDTGDTISKSKKVTSRAQKGDIQGKAEERVTSRAEKGDIAVSPEPSWNASSNNQSSEKQQQADTPDPPDYSAVVVQNLIDLNIPPNTAKRLASTYPAQCIFQQIAHYAHAKEKGKADGAGWLIKAIEGNWQIPEAVRKRLEAQDPRRYINGEYAEFIHH
jgi:hypothetical protein